MIITLRFHFRLGGHDHFWFLLIAMRNHIWERTLFWWAVQWRSVEDYDLLCPDRLIDRLTDWYVRG